MSTFALRIEFTLTASYLVDEIKKKLHKRAKVEKRGQCIFYYKMILDVLVKVRNLTDKREMHIILLLLSDIHVVLYINQI